MFHAELCDRSLLSTSSTRRVDASFCSGSEVRSKAVNVLKSHPPPEVKSSTAATPTVVSCNLSTTGTRTTSSASTTAISKSAVGTMTGFTFTQCQAGQVHSPSKVRRRRVTVPSFSSSSSLVTTTNHHTSSPVSSVSVASITSLLSGSDSVSRNHVDVILKSSAKEPEVGGLHLANGVNSNSSRILTSATTSSAPISTSNLTKTVTFSLSNPQNLNLVRLTPVSLRSNFERQPVSNAASVTEAEVKKLKELVLLHLDLVQQQQSIIAEKDKLIAELRSESNTVLLFIIAI